MIRSNTTFGDATRGSASRRAVKVDRRLLPENTPFITDRQLGEIPAVVAIRSTVQGLNVKDGSGVVSWTVTHGPDHEQILGKLLRDEVVRGQFGDLNQRLVNATPLRKHAFWEAWWGLPLDANNGIEIPELWATTLFCPSITTEEEARQQTARQQAEDGRWWYAWLVPNTWLSPLPTVETRVDLWEEMTTREAINKLLRNRATQPMMTLYEAWMGDSTIAAQMRRQGVPIHDKSRTRYQGEGGRKLFDLLAKFPPGEARTLCVSAKD